MSKTQGKAASKIAGMNAFDREQLVSKRVYKQLLVLDKTSRRRVLGILNDYAMQDDPRARELTAPEEETDVEIGEDGGEGDF